MCRILTCTASTPASNQLKRTRHGNVDLPTMVDGVRSQTYITKISHRVEDKSKRKNRNSQQRPLQLLQSLLSSHRGDSRAIVPKVTSRNSAPLPCTGALNSALTQNTLKTPDARPTIKDERAPCVNDLFPRSDANESDRCSLNSSPQACNMPRTAATKPCDLSHTVNAILKSFTRVNKMTTPRPLKDYPIKQEIYT